MVSRDLLLKFLVSVHIYGTVQAKNLLACRFRGVPTTENNKKIRYREEHREEHSASVVLSWCTL